MEEIVEFLRSRNTSRPSQQPYQPRNKKAYIICNELGSILVVYDSRRMLRKANMSNHADIRVPLPISIVSEMSASQCPKVTIDLLLDSQISLMYCHRVCEYVNSTCKKVILSGEACIVFLDSIKYEMEEWQSAHASSCNICSVCQSSVSFDLQDGDSLTFKGGRFYIRVSANKHCIFMSRTQFFEQVEYTSSYESMRTLLSILNS